MRAVDPEHTSPALVLAYAASYVVGCVLSYLVLRRRLGGLRRRRGWCRFLVRLALITGLATAVAAVPALALDRWSGTESWPRRRPGRRRDRSASTWWSSWSLPALLRCAR